MSAGCLQIVFGHKYSPSGAALPFWDQIVEIGLGGRFYKGKVLSNGVPRGERERDGHVTMRPRHKENGENNAETVVLV